MHVEISMSKSWFWEFAIIYRKLERTANCCVRLQWLFSFMLSKAQYLEICSEFCCLFLTSVMKPQKCAGIELEIEISLTPNPNIDSIFTFIQRRYITLYRENRFPPTYWVHLIASSFLLETTPAFCFHFLKVLFEPSCSSWWFVQRIYEFRW